MVETVNTPSDLPPLSWDALNTLPLSTLAPRIAYGSDSQQFGELRLPLGGGRFPVVALFHGGCWRNRFDLRHITRLAAWFAARGVATWCAEYRRLGDEGGGWPGTLLDAADALDALRGLAANCPLDLHRVYTAGHSAGGHLALWLASRARLPPDSDLFRLAPLPVAGVLALGAVTDLDLFRIGPPDSCHAAVELLMGGNPEAVPHRYAEASPLRRLPLGVPQLFIHGLEDEIVAASTVEAYAQTATRAGDSVSVLTLPGAGHFDTAVVTPRSEPAFAAALAWVLTGRLPKP